MEQYDKKKIYCRKLGHFLEFKYCRQCNNSLPCNLIADCWFEYLPIDNYLKENYSEKELAAILQPSKPKMASIFEMIEKAKKINEESGNRDKND